MSETKENQEGEEPSDEQVENPQTVSGVEEADPIQENPSQETPENKTPIMFGTRKLHPSSKSGSAKSLKQLRRPQEDDDILEMDDLVVKSTAPAHLMEDDRPNPNRRRNRDRNRDAEDKDQESRPATASDPEEVAYPVDEVNDEDRPERFAEVKKPDTARSRGVQEFRPSKDGKRGAPKKRSQASNSPTKRPASKEKPKGLFGWIKSVFTSEDEGATRSSDGKKRQSNQPPYRRGDIVRAATVSGIHEQHGIFFTLDKDNSGLYRKQNMEAMEWTMREGLYRVGEAMDVKVLKVKRKGKSGWNIEVESAD